MKKVVFSLLIVIGLAMVACMPPGTITQSVGPKKPVILTPLSEDIIKKYSLNEYKIKSIQVFNGPNGQQVVLKNTHTEKKDSIKDGKLYTIYVQKTDSVLIKPFTKGKIISVSSSKLSVAFETDSLTLVFGPSKNDAGKYILYTLDGGNEVMYGKKKYKLSSGGNGASVLYIDLESIIKKESTGRVAPGIEVR